MSRLELSEEQRSELEAWFRTTEDRCTLTLWEAGGSRSITVEGIVFPVLPAAPAQ